MDKNPVLLSICCITYNHENYISQAIEGFLAQKTSFNFEIIIHDDASTDATASIVKKYEQEHPNLIKAIYQTENQYSKGIKPWPNFVFPIARGKYIALCEGDDYWTDPYKLQKQVDFLEANPEYFIHYTNEDTLDEQNIRTKSYTFDFNDSIQSKQGSTLTAVFRNSIVFQNNIKAINFKDIKSGDWLIEILLTMQGLGFFDRNKTAYYRKHKKGVSRTFNEASYYKTRIAAAKQMLKIHKVSIGQSYFIQCFITRVYLRHLIFNITTKKGGPAIFRNLLPLATKLVFIPNPFKWIDEYKLTNILRIKGYKLF